MNKSSKCTMKLCHLGIEGGLSYILAVAMEIVKVR